MGLLDPFEPRSSPPPHDFSSSSIANVAPRSRKRSYLHLEHLESYPSSDPACFSSDPPEPSQDSYSIGSRKRQFRGSWWNHDASPLAKETYKSPFARKTRKFKRDFDSGVFMPSDGSDESLPDVGPIQLSPLNRSKRRVHTPHDLAVDIIEKCVKTDNEVVDLSDLNLETLDGESLAVLNTITKTNKVIDRSEGNLQDDDYQPLQPQLQLYLANNGLSQLPLPLWHLNRLTVLSLRNNGITFLPAAIANLQNLVELNLTNNKLEHLPWELVRNIVPNGSLEKLIASYNPLARPKADVRQGLAIVTHSIVSAGFISSAELPPNYQTGLRKIAELNTSTESQVLHTEMLHMFERHCMPQGGPSEVMRARSAPDLYCSSVSATRYFDECGSEIYPSRLGVGPSLQVNIDSRQPTRSGISSLFDTALRSYVTQFDGYDTELDDWDLGARVTQALVKATDIHTQHGLRNCSVCGRQYLIARTSWIEYYHRLTKGIAGMAAYNPDDLFLPMLRFGCSWACVPDPALRKATFSCG